MKKGFALLIYAIASDFVRVCRRPALEAESEGINSGNMSIINLFVPNSFAKGTFIRDKKD